MNLNSQAGLTTRLATLKKGKTMTHYVITKTNDYVDSKGLGGYRVGDIVRCERDNPEYGGFVIADGAYREHSAGYYYWSKEECDECLRPVGWLDLFKKYAEFESAGIWYWKGFIIVKDNDSARGWHVPGIDPYCRGLAWKPFQTMRDAMQWVEREYGDVKQWAS